MIGDQGTAARKWQNGNEEAGDQWHVSLLDNWCKDNCAPERYLWRAWSDRAVHCTITYNLFSFSEVDTIVPESLADYLSRVQWSQRLRTKGKHHLRPLVAVELLVNAGFQAITTNATLLEGFSVSACSFCLPVRKCSSRQKTSVDCHPCSWYSATALPCRYYFLTWSLVLV